MIQNIHLSVTLLTTAISFFLSNSATQISHQQRDFVISIPKNSRRAIIPQPRVVSLVSQKSKGKQVIETNSRLQLELEKRQTAINEKNEQLLSLNAELDAAKSVLNRRSIKFVIAWVDRLFGIIRPDKG